MAETTEPKADGGLLARAWGTAALPLTLTMLLWGGNAVAAQIAVGEVAPLTLVALRWLVVGAILWPIYGRAMRAAWPVVRARLWRVVLMAGLGFTAFNALFYAASLSTTAVNIGILQGSMPILVLIGAYLSFGDRVRPVQAVGAAVTLAGVALVATKGAPARLLDQGLNPGDGLMMIACVLYAGYTVALRGRPQVPGPVFFAVMATIALATSLPFAGAEIALGAGGWPSPTGWAVVLYTALGPSIGAQICFMRGVDLVGPGRAGVYINLVPVFAALLAVALLGQPFEGYHALALALVLGGIWLAQRRVAD